MNVQIIKSMFRFFKRMTYECSSIRRPYRYSNYIDSHPHQRIQNIHQEKAFQQNVLFHPSHNSTSQLFFESPFPAYQVSDGSPTSSLIPNFDIIASSGVCRGNNTSVRPYNVNNSFPYTQRKRRRRRRGKGNKNSSPRRFLNTFFQGNSSVYNKRYHDNTKWFISWNRNNSRNDAAYENNGFCQR